ncbi:MAG: sugar phosphate isomerase/epimerase family protein [Phycisphaerales bacterium JB063]
MIHCISYWSLPGGLENTCPIPDALQAAVQHEFQGVELCIGMQGRLTPDTPRSACEAIRDQIDQAGLVCQTLASGMSWAANPASDDAEVRAHAIAQHAAALERAAWLGCEAMLYVPGVAKSPISPDLVRYDKAVERVRDGVSELLETAERVGVDLCLENVWNGLFYSPTEFAGFIDSFNSDRLGVYLDVGNLMGYQQHPPHWIELLAHRIKRVHVKDFNESFGWLGSYAFCDLGAGQVPWEPTVQALRGVGYDKTVVAEMMPADPALLARTRAAMHTLFPRSTGHAIQ